MLIPYTYQKMRKFICTHCGKDYKSGSPQSRYCTITCQRAAKAKRRALRDSRINHEQITITETRFFAEVTNPSIVQLSKYAELIKDELTGDKPIRFLGEIPMFQPPEGVIFAQQHGLDHVEWLMLHPSMLE